MLLINNLSNIKKKFLFIKINYFTDDNLKSSWSVDLFNKVIFLVIYKQKLYNYLFNYHEVSI